MKKFTLFIMFVFVVAMLLAASVSDSILAGGYVK